MCGLFFSWKSGLVCFFLAFFLFLACLRAGLSFWRSFWSQLTLRVTTTITHLRMRVDFHQIIWLFDIKKKKKKKNLCLVTRSTKNMSQESKHRIPNHSAYVSTSQKVALPCHKKKVVLPSKPDRVAVIPFPQRSFSTQLLQNFLSQQVALWASFWIFFSEWSVSADCPRAS